MVYLYTMGKTQSKEEIIIAQNAAGGSNTSSIEEIKMQISTTNIILGIIVIMFLLVGCFFVLKIYKNCHTQLIRRELNSGYLRRSVYRRENRDRREDGSEQV